MAALAWLLIPLLAAIGAGLWGGWASRNRKSIGDGAELAGYTRFREAMESPARMPDQARSQAPKPGPTEA